MTTSSPRLLRPGKSTLTVCTVGSCSTRAASSSSETNVSFSSSTLGSHAISPCLRNCGQPASSSIAKVTRVPCFSQIKEYVAHSPIDAIHSALTNSSYRRLSTCRPKQHKSQSSSLSAPPSSNSRIPRHPRQCGGVGFGNQTVFRCRAAGYHQTCPESKSSLPFLTVA